MTRRQLGALFGAVAIGLPVGASRAHANETPTHDAIAITTVDYLELNLTSTDTELVMPLELAAGRYLVTIENQSTQGESAPVFVLLKDGQTAEELNAEPVDPTTGLPAWFLTGTVVGAPIAPLGMTAQAIVDFPAGNYAVMGEPYQPTFELAVTAAPSEAMADPDVGITITMGDEGWTGMPETAPAGRHLWKISSDGSVPHRFDLYSYPEPLTAESLIDALSLEEGATPPPGAPDISLAISVGGFSPMSTGQTVWPVVDLQPGTYIGLCTMQNGEAAVPHYLSGELTVFSVEEGVQ